MIFAVELDGVVRGAADGSEPAAEARAALLALRLRLAFADPAFIEHVRFASRYAGLSTESEGAALAMPRLPAA